MSIFVFNRAKSHLSVLCTEGLGTRLNQSHMQVLYQAVNEHRENWFHVFALLEKAAGQQHSTSSLWEASLCCSLWIHPLHTQIYAEVWHIPWPYQDGAHQLSWTGWDTVFQSCTAGRKRAEQVLMAMWKGIRELFIVLGFFKTLNFDVCHHDTLCQWLYQILEEINSTVSKCSLLIFQVAVAQTW